LFDGLAADLFVRLGAEAPKRLGLEYHWVRLARPGILGESEASVFLRWNLPLGHAWPCSPAKTDGFVEKAAQALLAKFGPRAPQGIFTAALHPTSPDRYFRQLASNLRGRLIQIFPPLQAVHVEDQDPEAETLFVLVGKEGLYAGMQSPRLSNGFFPGGSRYIAQDEPGTISRAGAKIAEALHYLRLHRPSLPPGAHWLELGACPGGMTSELLARGQRVTAIDRAPLDPRLDGREGLTFVLGDATRFRPPAGVIYDALLCDMNGPAAESIAAVTRLSAFVRVGGLVVFTLKLPRVESVAEPLELLARTTATAERAGLRRFAKTHLTYNRHEFTLFFEKARDHRV
jgi:23S rRNA C2498 (ribose-2'-O)-methylase RlmM